MKVLIIGAAGMIGRKFAEKLVETGTLAGNKVTRLTMADVIASAPIANSPFEIDVVTADLSVSEASERLIATQPDIIFHLAAIVSGEAESNFEKGYRINLSGTNHLFEAVRRAGYNPRIVFTSSIAVFGAPFPEVIGDDFFTTPLTSYGTQKAICELLLADYTRRGFFDGIGIRLPTVCVRPGKPNLAASGFFSNIIREPLKGEEAVLPVPETLRHWFASPRSVVGFLFHAAEIDATAIGSRRNLTMPGLSVTVGEMIESLKRVAGADRAKLIRRESDPAIVRMVEGWPRRFDASRALALGFEAETNFDDIIRAHIEDEHGGALQS
ncbi:MAG: SDR family oxidoreductase, partial [Verrucomicrobia bacterium]|nr:SDR family oxidoreductase [Verrucomicrobiota bacterium]